MSKGLFQRSMLGDRRSSPIVLSARADINWVLERGPQQPQFRDTDKIVCQDGTATWSLNESSRKFVMTEIGREETLMREGICTLKF